MILWPGAYVSTACFADVTAAADGRRTTADVDAVGACAGVGLRAEEEHGQEADAEDDGLETHFRGSVSDA